MKLRLCILLPLALALAAAAQAAQQAPQYRVVKRVVLGGEGGWDCLAVDSAAHRLYISRSTHVMVVDTGTCAVVGDIPNTPGVHSIVVAPALGRGFITVGGDNAVVVFDPNTLKVTARIPVGTRPDAIAYDRRAERVYSMNAGSQDVTAIDAATGKVVGTVALGGKPEFAVTDGRGMLYINLEDKGEIAAVDTKALAVKARWPIAPVEEPSGLAIDRRNRRLFAVGQTGVMAVVDADTGKVIATPPIGKGPDGAAFDRRSGLVFSPNGRDGTLTVVKQDASGKYVVPQTVTTEPGARTMALDARTSTIYLVTAKPKPAEPGQRRPQYEPGTFTLLVVGK